MTEHLDEVFLPLPGPIPDEAAAEFDLLLEGLASAPDAPLDLTGRTTRPIWQLLVHAASTGRFALHGSAADDIVEFEPRQSNDVEEFGNRTGVYAANDGLWPFYFAIVDRSKITSLVNGAFTRIDDQGVEHGPWYFCSVASDDPAPWREGTVYLMPIEGFEHQEAWQRDGHRVRTHQLFNPSPVRPVAKVRVRPEEFPLLASIRRHDGDEVRRRAEADPQGFPWL